jgi:hypothetical protein
MRRRREIAVYQKWWRKDYVKEFRTEFHKIVGGYK